MQCPFCGGKAEFVENKEVYGKNFGKSFMMWLCRKCDARVGVHENDPDRPLGTMANKDLRIWRIRAHEAIDHLWKSGKIKRRDVYQSLNAYFKRDIHIGESDIRTCQQIIEIFKKRK